MKDKQKNKCYYCCSDISKIYHGDHKIPTSRGGENNIGNIVLSCSRCNLYKSDIPYNMWMKIMEIYKLCMGKDSSKLLMKLLKKYLLVYDGYEYKFNRLKYIQLKNSKNILYSIVKDA